MEELAVERQSIRSALRDLHVDAWLFEEDAGARPETTAETYRSELNQSDLYIGVLWRKYGKYTAAEYRLARSRGMDCLIYVKTTDAKISLDPSLEAFIRELSKVESGITVCYFETSEQLETLVKRDVAAWQARTIHDRATSTIRRQTSQDSVDSEALLILLRRVRHYWIEGALEQSLHARVLLELGKEVLADMTQQPWERRFHQPSERPEVVPPSTPLADVFERSGRSLLLLGEPGSGKTTALLGLARTLCDRAEADSTEPVPVVLVLSAWRAENQDFGEWLVTELRLRYQIPERFGRQWIRSLRLLPLLDGLDEVAVQDREHCVTAINEYLDKAGAPGLVLTTREQEYIQLEARLRLAAAVSLQPLTEKATRSLLDASGARLPDLRAAIAADPDLVDLARRPLFLDLMIATYASGGEALGATESATLAEKRKRLIGGYLTSMIARRVQHNQKVQNFKDRLAWLAGQMRRQGQYQFQIDHIQPSWLLSPYERSVYHVAFFVICFLIDGPLLLLLRYVGAEPVNSLELIAMQPGIVIWLGMQRARALLQPPYIYTVERLKWSWSSAISSLESCAVFSTLVTLFLLLGTYYVNSSLVWPAGAVVSLFGVMLGTAIQVVVHGLEFAPLEKAITPTDRLRRSLGNSARAGGIAAVLAISSFAFLLFLLGRIGSQGTFPWKHAMGEAVVLGSVPAVMMAGWFGGYSVIENLSLRFAVSTVGEQPLRLVRFLDECVNLGILQRVGGSYQFIHRLVMEHVADEGPTFNFRTLDSGDFRPKAPAPLNSLHASWRCHRAAVWWIWLAMHRPVTFRREVEELPKESIGRAGDQLHFHLLPYVLLALACVRLIPRAKALGLVPLKGVLWTSLGGILTGSLSGLLTAALMAVMLGVFYRTAHCMFFGSLTAGIGCSSVLVVSRIIGGNCATAIALGVWVGLWLPVAKVFAHVEIESRWRPFGGRMIRPMEPVIAILYAVGGGLAVGFLAHSISLALLAALTFLAVVSRSYYLPVHLFFLAFLRKGKFYKWHPVAWDDLSSFRFPGLKSLIIELARFDHDAGQEEIRRLLNVSPANMEEALAAKAVVDRW
jgi:hypothetical protein